MPVDKLSATQILFPVALLAVALLGSITYQTSLLVSDRDALHQAYSQQEKPLAQVEKIKSQLNALAIGTLKLSQQGNKDAQTIIAQMQKAGINVTDQPPAGEGVGAPSGMQPAPGQGMPGQGAMMPQPAMTR